MTIRSKPNKFSGGLEQRWWPLLFLCLFFSLLFVLLLPFDFSYKYRFNIKVTALGMKDPRAKSAEVWIAYPKAELVKSGLLTARTPKGWEEKYDRYVSYKEQPSSINFEFYGKTADNLVFASHEYSGYARVQINGVTVDLDLYSATPTEHRISLVPFIVDEAKSDQRRIVPAVSLYFSAIMLGLLSFAIVIFRYTTHSVGQLDSHRATATDWLLFALPSMMVFGIVHAAYWPGQLSPDSIDQWSQAITRSYSDNHPFLNSMFMSGAIALGAGPSHVIAIQYVLLALSIGVLLAEFRAWGINPKLIWVAALLIPIFPATPLVATTLWKDVPYSAAFIYLISATLALLRKQWQVSNQFLLGLFFVALLMIFSRHNGVVVAPPTLLILGIAGWKISSGKKLVGLSGATLLVFLAAKLILQPAAQVVPLGAHYKAMNAIHIIGGMVNNEVELSSSDKLLLEGLMPLSDWQASYVCQNAVPLFWKNGSKGFDYLGEKAFEINRLALKLIAANPSTFLSHYGCVTSFLWRIKARPDDWIPISPSGITPMEGNSDKGLVEASLLPSLRAWMNERIERNVINSPIFGRSPIFLFFFIFGISIYSAIHGRRYGILATPFILHTGSLALLAAAPDYRYQFPVVIGAIALSFLFLFSRKCNQRPVDS